MSKVLDTISATNVGGRNGKGKSSDGKVEIQFSLAKALGGKGEGATPEHMFALGYSACFASAMQFVAGQKKIHLPPDFSITTKVDLTQTDKQEFQLAVELVAKADGIDKAALEDLLKVSHTVCPLLPRDPRQRRREIERGLSSPSYKSHWSHKSHRSHSAIR